MTPLPSSGDSNSAVLPRIFDALEQALSEQLRSTSQGDFDAAQQAVDRVGSLIAELLNHRPIPEEFRDRLARFEQQHKMARLAMLAKRQDLDLELRRVRGGRNVAKYR